MHMTGEFCVLGGPLNISLIHLFFDIVYCKFTHNQQEHATFTWSMA